MSVEARRFLVVPDPTFDSAALVRTELVTPGSWSTTDAHEEAGLQIEQPTPGTGAPVGDIALTLSGEPETHVEGTVRLSRGGVVEDARFGWVNASADPDQDLQFRQSPHVVGRRVDCLEYWKVDNEVSLRPVRPRLLALLSGDALCVWTQRYDNPIFNAQDVGPFSWKVMLSRLAHGTDTWTDPAQIVAHILGELLTGLDYVSAVDFTQYPDTGEIILCVATADSLGTPTARKLSVYASTDDGATWVLRHRLSFDGTVPDILLDADGDGDVDDTTAIQDWVLELLDSGRLCLFTVTEDYTWSLVSDDRGASWGVTRVATHAAATKFPGHGVGATKARNGMGVFTRSLRNDTERSVPGVWLSRDGVVFSAEVKLDRTAGGAHYYETGDITICISPDGWPHVYGTEHGVEPPEGGGTVPQDWMWGRRIKTRDPSISDTADDLVPANSTPNFNLWAFHCIEGAPDGTYEIDALAPDPPVYGGFTGLDAIQYRGHVIMAVVAVQEGEQPVTYVQPKLLTAGLVIYRLNHWQPVQERMGNAYDDPNYYPAFPAYGRIYNRTWDCYGLPDDWGYAVAGAGSVSLVAAGADGGKLKLAGGQKYYTDTTLPATETECGGMLRFVLSVVSGGSDAADQIGVRLKLSDAASHTDVSIRFKLAAANLASITIYDNVAGTVVGATVTLAFSTWIEVLYCQRQGIGDPTLVEATCLVRPYIRATDPDWDREYTEVVLDETIALGAGLTESLAFGNLSTGGTSESWWKSVHLHRGGAQEECALVRSGVDFIDTDALADRTIVGAGEVPLDNCLDNWMRTSRAIAEPPMWLARGVYARYRGEAVTEGTWAIETGYSCSAENVLIQPVLREWRSTTNDDTYDIALVFDAGACGIHPDAVAVFGHNVFGIRFQFSATDDWTTPAVDFELGIPWTATTRDRYTHEWASQGTAHDALSFTISGYKISVSGAALSFTISGYKISVSGAAPWRPHQFKSEPGGQAHYLALGSGSGKTVFRIADNTADTLTVTSSFAAAGWSDGALSSKNYVVIYSDRFAVMVGHQFPTAVTYRYCRIVVKGCEHCDPDEAFARIGRILMGSTIEMSAPDFEWGWSMAQDTGADIVEQETGAAYAKNGRPILRTVTADRPWMFAPAEAAAVYQSPMTQDARATWAHWLDTMRLIDGGAIACALVWDGERFVGFAGEEPVQVAADPLGLLMCHVTGLGDVEHLAYDGRLENTPSTVAGATACVPRPVSHIRGLAFRETL